MVDVLLNSGDGAVRTSKARVAYHPKPRQASDIRHHQQRVSAPKSNSKEPLVQAQALCEAGDYDAAWAIVDRALTYGDPNEPNALIIACQVQVKWRNLTVAYQFAKRLTEVAGDRCQSWLNLGYLEEQFYRFDDAENCYRRAIAIARSDDEKGAIYMNWSSLLCSRADWESAEVMARKAMRYRPKSPKPKANLGIALLAQHKWREGWPLYNQGLGIEAFTVRAKLNYADAPDWDGRRCKLIVYGEQGLGDEISFASMIPDACKAADVIVDCDYRLKGLFTRSFPNAEVHGTRWAQPEQRGWVDRVKADAKVSVGQLGQFFRNDPADFTGKPYLIPCPDRTAMWKALFKSFGKPVIGVAWSGGLPYTADRFRRWTLEEMLPLFERDAVYVSLQYQDAAREIATFRDNNPSIDLRQYAYGTLTKDYDDTAALVAACDEVVSMQTSVIHLAGALGVPTTCYVNRYSQWRYGKDSFPWAKSVNLKRANTDGSWTL